MCVIIAFTQGVLIRGSSGQFTALPAAMMFASLQPSKK
jgi:hypothetical protein